LQILLVAPSPLFWTYLGITFVPVHRFFADVSNCHQLTLNYFIDFFTWTLIKVTILDHSDGFDCESRLSLQLLSLAWVVCIQFQFQLCLTWFITGLPHHDLEIDFMALLNCLNPGACVSLIIWSFHPMNSYLPSDWVNWRYDTCSGATISVAEWQKDLMRHPKTDTNVPIYYY